MSKAISYIKESLIAYYPESEISGFTRIIIEHVTGKSYHQVLLDDKSLTDEQQKKIQTIVKRLKKQEPIQHIIEETEFFGLPFFVNKNVLIPRPETEELVELIINENKATNLNVLDIGTGSGAIAIALARHMTEANISAWDVSSMALDVAVINAKANNVDLSFKLVDVLKEHPQEVKFDIIVSNPPYILEKEKEDMEQNVLAHEPHLALFVPDNQPLLFYERIADIALHLLNPKGKLYFEINRAKGKEIVKILEGKGFIGVALFQDLSGNDRMVRAKIK